MPLSAHTCRSRHRPTPQCSFRIADIHKLRSISTAAMTAERTKLPLAQIEDYGVLNAIPQLDVDDGLMLPVPDIGFVPDLRDIDGIAEQRVVIEPVSVRIQATFNKSPHWIDFRELHTVMNLLITNTQEDQAYLILLCLQKDASKIIVTISGNSLFKRWSGISQWSRFVSKRYKVPDFYAGWKSGLMQAGNTAAEELYIQRIEEICAVENIDTIFPSYDPEVYIFSKNKLRLAGQGILAVVPDYEALHRILDKSLTMAAAAKVGLPIPRTAVPADLEALRAASESFGGPWVLKPRCSAHGENIMMFSSAELLEEGFNDLKKIQERPMLQDYIPEASKRNYYVVVDRNSEIVSMFSPIVNRTRKIGARSSCAAVLSCSDVPFADEVQGLLRELAIWGGLTIQTVVDARDGKPKLMEINPRFGHALWYRTVLGINEPRMVLQIARGERPEPPPAFRENVLMLDPLWDLLHLIGQTADQTLGYIRSKFSSAVEDDEMPGKESISQILRAYKAEYFSKRDRILNSLNRGFFNDPFPPLVRIIRVFIEALQRRAG